MAKKIMAWSKCKIEIGETGYNDAMCADASLTDVGVILNQSSTLTAEVGDAMQAIATGGEIVAEEPQEGTLVLEATIIEPTHELLHLLGLTEIEVAEDDEEEVDDVDINTHVVAGSWSVKVTPKNEGAWGIKAPKTTISYIPAWSEENGNQAVLRFSILKTTEFATSFYKKQMGIWTPFMAADPSQIDIEGWLFDANQLPDDAENGTIYAVGYNYWYQRFMTEEPL